MHIRYFFQLLAFFTFLSLQAQSLSIRLHGGYGAAELSNYFKTKNDVWGADRVHVPMYGIGLQFHFNHWFSLQTELNRVQKGNIRYGLENRYHYWHWPMMTRFDWNVGDRLCFFGQGGGYLAKLRQQTQGYTGDGPFAEIYLIEYGPAARYDFGLSSGFGGSCSIMPNLALEIEFRGDLGLGSALDLPPDYNIPTIRNVSGWGMVGLKYTFKS